MTTAQLARRFIGYLRAIERAETLDDAQREARLAIKVLEKAT